MTLPAFALKKKQYLVAGGAGLVGLLLIGTLFWSVDNGKQNSEDEPPLKETKITTAGQRVNPQEIWVERLESENKLTRSKLDALEKILMENIKSNAESDHRLTDLQQQME